MKPAILVAAGVTALAVGLVVYLPARIVAGWVQAAVPTLQLRGVTGTALHGQATSLLYGNLPLQGIEWHAHPAALLLGRVSADFSIDTDVGQLTGGVSHSLFGGNLSADVHGGASIKWLALRGGYTFIPVAGRLRVDLSTLQLTPKGVVAAATGVAKGDSLSWQLLNPPAPLGNLAADVKHQNGNITIKITDSHGALAIAGNVSLNPRGRYHVNLRLRPRTEADPRLKKLMTQIGHTDAQGWYHIQENGHL